MRAEPESSSLVARQSSNTAAAGTKVKGGVVVIIILSFLIFFAFIALIYLVLRRLRGRYENPRYVPTKALKRIWQAWRPRRSPRGRYDRGGENEERLQINSNQSRPDSTLVTASTSAAAACDRHTSVRSVATLPVYKPTAHDSEQILGREGERGGIDVVIEFPETAEEEESRRDEHMEALFQIRQTRRVEAAEREDRRRRRREARERGDTMALEAIRIESRQVRARAESAAERLATSDGGRAGGGGGGGVGGAIGGASNTSLPLSLLSLEQASRIERERRISSVSYADVGLARHDGTRVRASSESERPLLEGAMSMGSRPHSPSLMGGGRQRHPQRPSHHRRDSSMHSMSTTTGSIDGGEGYSRIPVFAPTHSRHVSQTSEILGGPADSSTSTNLVALSSSSPSIRPATAPPHPSLPPNYEDISLEDEEAPPYETITPHLPIISGGGGGGGGGGSSSSSSTVRRNDDGGASASPNHAPQLPPLRTLPAIEITADTPITSTPPSPR